MKRMIQCYVNTLQTCISERNTFPYTKSTVSTIVAGVFSGLNEAAGRLQLQLVVKCYGEKTGQKPTKTKSRLYIFNSRLHYIMNNTKIKQGQHSFFIKYKFESILGVCCKPQKF